jgi:hypothetical protein
MQNHAKEVKMDKYSKMIQSDPLKITIKLTWHTTENKREEINSTEKYNSTNNCLTEKSKSWDSRKFLVRMSVIVRVSGGLLLVNEALKSNTCINTTFIT